MPKEFVVGLLTVIIYLLVLLSNYVCYRRFPEERWPMVLLATLIWFGPITGLGWLLWGIPEWFVGAQSLCLASAFFATMTLKFTWYRRVAIEEERGPHLLLWQRETLDNVQYSLDRQAGHIQAILKARKEMDALLSSMREHQEALDRDVQQTELYRQISRNTVNDFIGGIASCYLAEKQKIEASNAGSGPDEENSLRIE